MFILIIGYAAAAIEILMGLPQAVQTFKQRNDFVALGGLSMPSQILMFLHTIMWCVYAIGQDELPVFLAHAPAIPIYGAVVLLILRARHLRKVEVKKSGS